MPENEGKGSGKSDTDRIVEQLKETNYYLKAIAVALIVIATAAFFASFVMMVIAKR